MNHGYTQYSHGCRCQACRAAKARYMSKQRTGRHGLPASDPRHGTTTAYRNHRCRCETCRAGQRQRDRARTGGDGHA